MIIICAILANKRLYQLSDAAVLTDKYIAIDKAGSSEAERYPITNFPTTTYVTNNFAPIDVDYKCNEVAVVAGANSITFLTAFPAATTYSLVVLDVIMADGTKSFGQDSTHTVSGFDFNSMDAGTLKYVALKIR